MNCATHTQTPAAAFCRTCGRALCATCRRDVHGVVFCEDCLARRVEGAVPPGYAPPPPGAQAVNPNAPNPAVAAILGLIPGVGAMYAGEFTKAFFHVLVFASLIWAVSTVDFFAPFFGMLIAFWYFYMIFDSYRTAKAKQLGEPVPDPFGFTTLFSSSPGKSPVAFDYRREHFPTAAVLLIALGVMFLLGNVYDMRAIVKLWPLLLIYFGVTRFLAVRRSTLCPCVRCQASRMMSPAVLITLGALFMLDQWTDIKFRHTFPAILIVIGAVKLLEAAGSTEGHIETPPPPVVIAGSDPGTTAPQSAEESETRHG